MDFKEYEFIVSIIDVTRFGNANGRYQRSKTQGSDNRDERETSNCTMNKSFDAEESHENIHPVKRWKSSA